MRLFTITMLLALSLPVLACDGREYRQFDFWLGDWDVFTRNGIKPG